MLGEEVSASIFSWVAASLLPGNFTKLGLVPCKRSSSANFSVFLEIHKEVVYVITKEKPKVLHVPRCISRPPQVAWVMQQDNKLQKTPTLHHSDIKRHAAT